MTARCCPLRLKDPFRYERGWWGVGTKWVAGVDEAAGRAGGGQSLSRPFDGPAPSPLS